MRCGAFGLAALAVLTGMVSDSASWAEDTFSIPPRYEKARDGLFTGVRAAPVFVTRGAPAHAEAFWSGAGGRSAAPCPDALPAGGFVLAGLASEHPLLAHLRERMKLWIPAQGLGDEGFLIDIGPDRILIASEGEAGLYYGFRSIASMLEQEGGGALRCRTVADWPVLKRRGFHLLATGRASLGPIEKMLTETLPRRRANTVIFEINYSYEFRSHPEVREDDSFTREDIKRVLKLAADHNIRIIPEMNCLGHQSWAGKPLALLKAYPEFDEMAGLPEIYPKPRPACWCPSNPKVMPVVRDLIGELIDVFGAEEFHCGMDEAFYVGKCERCSKLAPSVLFARSAVDLHAYVTGERKARMLIWGDRLLDARAFGYSEWEGSITGTHDAAGMIPTDIVICDWHYGERDEYPSIPYLQGLGFRVWPTAWKTRGNAERLATYTLAHNSKRVEGYLASSWTLLTPLQKGFEGEAESLKSKNVADVIEATNVGLAMAWTGRR